MQAVTVYDGCGKCLVGVRRLSRKSDATNSPEKQASQVTKAVTAVGGHIIGWADDWEVSGATDPLTRPELGPWLRGEMGAYDGIAGSAVDRIGRNARDVLNTGDLMKTTGRLLITYGHDGPWNLDDANDETLFTMHALGAQLELRNIQRRNREAAVAAREAGRPSNRPPYGYEYVRLVPTGRIDHVVHHPFAAANIREVAERILTDGTGTITVDTEAARMTRAGILSPKDHLAIMYGRESQAGKWTGRALRGILTSEAALGYLMHQGRALIGRDGNKIRIAPPLWDEATRDALIEKTAPKKPLPNRPRAPKGTRLLSGIAFCGTCGARLNVSVGNGRLRYWCTARAEGCPASAHCKPAPSMRLELLDRAVAERFLGKYGTYPVLKREFDPGTGYAARIKQLEADRARLRADREAGLYDTPEDTAWFRQVYTTKAQEIAELSALPDRPAAMRWVPSGQTIADRWHGAPDDAARRELLALYHLKVVLYPARSAQRVWIHALDPEVEAAALAVIAEQERSEADDAAELAVIRTDEHEDADALTDLLFDQASAADAIDAGELAYRHEQDQAAAEGIGTITSGPEEPYTLAA
ncbi:MAG TPA: recombinase family protein [Actinocrinis sp.]